MVWLVLLLLMGMGCITRDEGCLDIEADNFDFNAERDCHDCCTYPALNLTLSQKWGDRNFTTQDTLYDLNQQPYKIIDLNYFLSDWSWMTEEGLSYTVEEITVPCKLQGDLSFTPDVILVDSKKFNYTLGDVRLAVPIRKITLTWGSQTDYSCLDPDHPLTPDNVTSESPMWDAQAGSLNTLRLVLQRDLAVESYDTLFIPWSTDVPLTLPDLTLDMTRGLSTNIRLTADYQQWWMDARIDDPETFKTSVVQHMAFTLTP